MGFFNNNPDPYTIIANKEKGKISFIYGGNSHEIILTSIPSSLGVGVVWYFLCPVTGKRARKLRYYRGQFMHISAIPANYSYQNYSKNQRAIDIVARAEFMDPGDECFKKYFRFTYAGKPTKAMQRVEKKAQKYQAGKSKHLKEFFKIMQPKKTGF